MALRYIEAISLDPVPSTPAQENDMSEQTNSVEQNGTATTTTAKLYASKDEATAAKPDGKRFRLFEVVQNGTSRFVWAGGHGEAVSIAARQDGYTSTLADRKSGGVVTKETVAARLAEFSDEELQQLGLSRRKSKK
jgi:hypothetical protein